MKFIYLLRSVDPDSGQIKHKIGFTKNEPAKRVKQLTTGSNNEIDVLFVFESEYATKVEKALHRYFAAQHVGREWFILNQEQIKEFKAVCERFHNNFKLLMEENTYITSLKRY